MDAAWLAIQTLIKQFSDQVAKLLPGFWRIAKACMEGSYRKRDATGNLSATHRPASTCRSMALEIIKLYVSSLSQFFTLSDVGVSESSKRTTDEIELPPFVPAGTTVITAAFFAERLIEEVSDCVGELLAVEVAAEAGHSLRNMTDSLRWRFEEVMAATWANGV